MAIVVGCTTKPDDLMAAANMTGRRAGFLVLLVTAVRLVAAPPEPIQKPVKLLGLGENVDREFATLTDMGITPSLTYYGVFQGNPVGGIQQRTAYSQLILFGVELNFEKLVGLPGGSLTISGAQAMGENLSTYIGNINTVSEAFATPETVLFYQLYWKGSSGFSVGFCKGSGIEQNAPRS